MSYLFTFCPPGPEDLLNEISNKLGGIVSVSNFASQVRALVSSSSVAFSVFVLLANARENKLVCEGLVRATNRNIVDAVGRVFHALYLDIFTCASFDDGEPYHVVVLPWRAELGRVSRSDVTIMRQLFAHAFTS